MKIYHLLVLCMSLIAFNVSADQFETGKKKAEVCMTCHGANGIAAINTYPNLQGQHAEYLIEALKAYKEKRRTGGLAMLMQPQAEALTEQDMKDIAYYFSKVKSE